MTDTAHTDPHDRTMRFMQTAFSWDTAPSAGGLREAAAQCRITVSARPDLQSQQRLTVFALANVLGRLPTPVQFAVADCPLDHPPPPPFPGGDTLIDAVRRIAPRLPGSVSIGDAPREATLRMTIRTTTTQTNTWTILTDQWTAGLQPHPGPLTSNQATTPIGAYLAACAAGGEALRAWARNTAEIGIGVASPRLNAQARPATDHLLDLGPAPDAAPDLPAIDWASAGAVNQATLAVLAAQPDLRLRGRVLDPKTLDPPDLNRSLLALTTDEGRPKAEIAARAADLNWQTGAYPESLADRPATWVVTGTDDPQARARIQRAAPNTILVTATEDLHGLSSWHRLGTAGPCAACDIDAESLPTEPLPTTAPTSAAPGVLTAARMLQLAAGHQVAPEAALSTLRLDDDLDQTQQPEADPDCIVCAGHGPRTP